MSECDNLFEVVPLGSSRHPILRSWWRRQWYAPSLVVFDISPFGFAMPDPDVGRFHVRTRRVGSEWSDGSIPCSVYRRVQVPMEPGSETEVQIWADRPLFRRLVYECTLVVPDWDIYMVLIRVRPFPARSWLMLPDLIEAGWISEYAALASLLDRAEPAADP